MSGPGKRFLHTHTKVLLSILKSVSADSPITAYALSYYTDYDAWAVQKALERLLERGYVMDIGKDDKGRKLYQCTEAVEQQAAPPTALMFRSKVSTDTSTKIARTYNPESGTTLITFIKHKAAHDTCKPSTDFNHTSSLVRINL